MKIDTYLPITRAASLSKGVRSLKKWTLITVISLIACTLGGFVYFVAAGTADAELRQKFDACIAARANGTSGSITEYICPSGKVQTEQDIAYQIALDLAFRKLDTEIEKTLQGYQSQKQKDPVIINTQLVDWFDATGPKAKDSFPVKYQAICQDLQSKEHPLARVIATFSGATTDGATSDFILGGEGCLSLVGSKMAAYRDMAYLIGLKGAVSSYQEDKNKFVGSVNEQYQNFLTQWTIYVGELSRIKSKWNVKTPTQNG